MKAIRMGVGLAKKGTTENTESAEKRGISTNHTNHTNKKDHRRAEDAAFEATGGDVNATATSSVLSVFSVVLKSTAPKGAVFVWFVDSFTSRSRP
jgi:hypothetical protein